jgi:hypothetical protein
MAQRDASQSPRKGREMHSAIWSWIVTVLGKSALLGLPTLITLVLWRRRGIQSRALNQVGWGNLLGYTAWLLAVVVLMPLSEIPRYHWIAGSSIPANLFFIIPFLLAIGSFITCLLCATAEKGERRYPLLANGLMLILWSWLVVPPN